MQMSQHRNSLLGSLVVADFCVIFLYYNLLLIICHLCCSVFIFCYRIFSFYHFSTQYFWAGFRHSLCECVSPLSAYYCTWAGAVRARELCQSFRQLFFFFVFLAVRRPSFLVLSCFQRTHVYIARTDAARHVLNLYYFSATRYCT